MGGHIFRNAFVSSQLNAIAQHTERAAPCAGFLACDCFVLLTLSLLRRVGRERFWVVPPDVKATLIHDGRQLGWLVPFRLNQPKNKSDADSCSPGRAGRLGSGPKTLMAISHCRQKATRRNWRMRQTKRRLCEPDSDQGLGWKLGTALCEVKGNPQDSYHS